MSRIRRVGGNIIKRTKGDHIMYSGGSIITTSRGKIIEHGEEGITYGDAEEYLSGLNDLPIDCVVHFRPHQGWKGEYGFDWMRMGFGETAFEGDKPYRNYVMRALGATAQAQAYSKLKDVYDSLVKRRFITWGIKGENGETLKDENNKPLIDAYYPSWLMLFPEQIKDENTGEWKASGYENTEATLSMIVDNQTSAIKKYRLEYDKELFEVSHSEIPTTKGLYKNLEFKVKCLKSFDKLQEIRIIGLEEGDNTSESIPHRNIVGKLKLLDNATIYQPKIVLVKVTTDFEVKGRLRTGEPKTAPEPEIQKYLKQALILPQEIVWDELNITLDKEEIYFAPGSSTPNKTKRRDKFLKHRGMLNGKARIIHTSQELQTDLVEALAHETKNKYAAHFKVFYIDEATMADEGEDTFNGISYPIPDFRTCIVFRGGLKDKDTVTHELLHSMGLRHSFDEGNLFVFRDKVTDNIMDYDEIKIIETGEKVKKSPDKLQLWKWQIDIIRENAKNNKFILKP